MIRKQSITKTYFTFKIRDPRLGTNPLTCLKTGTNRLEYLFPAEQIRWRNKSAGGTNHLLHRIGMRVCSGNMPTDSSTPNV